MAVDAPSMAHDNWRRLLMKVQATPSSHDHFTSDPESTSNINNLLHVANEIEKENPDVSAYILDHALSLSHQLDVDCKGRGVLQLKTGLMSRLKDRQVGDGGNFFVHKKGPQYQKRKIEILEDYYMKYRQRHPSLDELQRHPRDGAKESEVEEGRRREVTMTLQALQDVINEENDLISEDFRSIMDSDAKFFPRTFNILPLEGPYHTKLLEFSEVKAARVALRTSIENDIQGPWHNKKDVFDVLRAVFGFQPDNVRNQREHLVLLLANSQSKEFEKTKSEDLHETIGKVSKSILDNYEDWCSYIRVNHAYGRNLDTIDDTTKVALVALYLCIWGEAANVRFLPECICYIFHNMAEELLAVLREKRIILSKSCEDKGGISFLKAIITPMYDALKEEANKNKAGTTAHSKWRNYDDFNEFFWSHSCLRKLKGWPLAKQKLPSFFLSKKGTLHSTKKISFVEHRTFLHLYHSFVRVWILLAMMLQGLAILSLTEGFSIDRLKILLSLGPTYFVMKFMESLSDMVMMYGAYFSSRSDAVARIFTHFFFYGGFSGGLSYLYWRMLIEAAPSYFFLKVISLVLGSYAALKLLLSLLQHMPLVGEKKWKTDKYGVADTLKWLYKEQFYVGRDLYEQPRDYLRYFLFWTALLASKFTFSYFLQIKPVAEATRTIYQYTGRFTYEWHDFISERNHNALSLFFIWSPIVLVYFLDIQIWFALFSAIVGGIIGAKDRLGEIRSLDMLRDRFDSFPEAFIKNLCYDKPPSNAPQSVPVANGEALLERIRDASIYAPFWNEIIHCLREEDYITNAEKELLIMPSHSEKELHNNPPADKSMEYIRWPLFLLASKVHLAMKLAMEKRENPYEVWERLHEDMYMLLAVREAFESVKDLLCDIVINAIFFDKVYSDIETIHYKDFFAEFRIDEIRNIHKKVVALTMLLLQTQKDKHGQTQKDKQGQAKINRALKNIYDAVLRFHPHYQAEHQNYEPIYNDVDLSAQEMKERIQRVHLLLTTTESASTIPKNGEARRRLEFFTNSLFMTMPTAPSVRAMKSFSVLTPYYNEIVMFSMEELQKENEDGITILFYLQKIFPDEWQNFLERIEKIEKAVARAPEHENEELRLWASYRGQTLARTVRGMMYYRRALELQAWLDGPEVDRASRKSLAESLADYKFTYVVSCQIYGQQKTSLKKEDAAKAKDILYLLKNNKGLRIAFVDKVDNAYFSKLVKLSEDRDKDEVIYSIKLPGDPKLGEGKPENQNHAMIFTRGHALQTIDMNQDNSFEEALKMRNLLEEFEADHGFHRPTILGVREHVFTGSVSSLAWFMSNQETSFVTLGQRVSARPLKVRMHYGHPDVFDRLFHLTRGGISKASKTINVSEDIFAGFNSTLRQGNITHHEYIQVGKGRDVGLNQIAMFEAKVSSGNAEQLLSRDVYRLGQLFDFFRMLSFYVTSVGYYACTMMTTLVVYFFLYGEAYLALSGVGRSLRRLAISTGDRALQTALSAQFLVQIGIFTAIPMLMVFILEQGIFQAIVNFITMQLQLCSVFFTFSLGTRTHYFGRTVLHGGAKYRETGRGFVVRHIKFADNYRLYSRSHFVKALEIIMLLLVIRAYGSDSSTLSYFWFSFFSWFLALSWLFAPFIFNPSGFEWQKTVEDFDDWVSWLTSKGVVGVYANSSWEAWWLQEQEHIRSPVGRTLESLLSLRFFLFQFGVVYHLKAAEGSLSLSVYGISWLVLVGVILVVLIFSPSTSGDYQLSLRLAQSLIFVILVASLVTVLVLHKLAVEDICASLLALIPTGWGILCIGIAWRPVVNRMGLWKAVRSLAWSFEAAMGLLIFFPIAVLSWFPFVSTFQTRLLFNQAFSRGLEISLILAGNRSKAKDQ